MDPTDRLDPLARPDQMEKRAQLVRMATLDPQDPQDKKDQQALLARMVRRVLQDQLARMEAEDH